MNFSARSLTVSALRYMRTNSGDTCSGWINQLLFNFSKTDYQR